MRHPHLGRMRPVEPLPRAFRARELFEATVRPHTGKKRDFTPRAVPVLVAVSFSGLAVSPFRLNGGPSMSDHKTTNGGFADVAMLVRAFQLSKMLQVAAALNLADRIADGRFPVGRLASECGADPGMLLRLCRALAAFGIFMVTPDGEVSHTSRSAWLRKDSKPTLYYAARYWTTPGNWHAWGNLEHAVRTGRSPFLETFGIPNFEYLAGHPEEASLFDLFMQHSPDDRHAAVLEAYDFSSGRQVVDVGGGNGALLAAILMAHGDLGGLLFDQEAVVASAREMLRHRGLSERCRIEAGNFFEAVPKGGDIYTLSQILHDWDDERCMTILSNCRAAMGPNSRLLVIERVLADQPGQTNPLSYLADMHMMVIFDGAKERTETEFGGLLARSGFSTPRVLETRSPFSILETEPV